MGSKRATIDWTAQPLGQESDRRIADRLGVSSSLVRKVRIGKGIAAAPHNGRRPREFRVRDYGPSLAQDVATGALTRSFQLACAEPSPGWLNGATERRPPAEPVSLPEPPPAPEPSPEETARLVELGLVHIHICPMCRERRTCSRDDCQAMGLETEDGAPYSYRTCPICVGRLERDSGTTGQRLVIRGGTGAPTG